MNPLLHARFPNASQDVIALNPASAELPKRTEEKGSCRDRDAASNSKLEQNPRRAALGPRQKKKGNPDRYVVRIVSVRSRLLDQDNLCPKYAVDFLRYCGAIPSDAPGTTAIETTQRKTQEGEEDHTEIKVWKIYGAK